jgi:hypothetical protein
MIPLCCAPISTRFGQKSVEVYLGDICLFDETIDILTTSAFVRSYNPTPRTVFEALNNLKEKWCYTTTALPPSPDAAEPFEMKNPFVYVVKNSI